MKAEFLFHFAQLVDWPSTSVAGDERTISVCIAENSPFRNKLDQIQGRQIQARFLRMRYLKDNDDARNCQILFVGPADRKRSAAILSRVKGAPVLTVGEEDSFLQQGGMIAFCWHENKVRFDINIQAAERAQIKVSSRLLLLAKNVLGTPKVQKAGD